MVIRADPVPQAVRGGRRATIAVLFRRCNSAAQQRGAIAAQAKAAALQPWIVEIQGLGALRVRTQDRPRSPERRVEMPR